MISESKKEIEGESGGREMVGERERKETSRCERNINRLPPVRAPTRN